MVLPLNDDFSLIRGKLIESSDFEKLGDEAALLRISEEFPEYRKVKVKEGFMQIFEQHLGVVESVENDIYNVRYWEKLIPAKLAGDINEKPKAGSDVKFKWNHGVHRALAFCRWWMSRHAHGPLEYLWKRATWLK